MMSSTELQFRLTSDIYFGLHPEINSILHQFICNTCLCLNQPIGNIIFWDFDANNGYLPCARAKESFCLQIKSSDVSWDAIHPDDCQKIIDATQLLLSENIQLDVTYRVLTPASDIRRMRCTGQTEFNRVRGVIQDVTELHVDQNQRGLLTDKQKAILENRLVAIATVCNRKIIWANLAYETLFGYSKDELIGVTPRQLYLSDADYQSVGDAYATIGNNEIVRSQHEFVRKDGRHIWVDMRGSLLNKESGETLWVFVDVTERILAEQNQARLARALKLLSKCNSALIRVEDEHKLLVEICQLAAETGGYLMAWVGYAGNDEFKTVHPIAQSGYEDGYLDHVTISWADTELGHGPTGTAIRTGKTVIAQNFQANPKMILWRDIAIKRGYHSSISLPLFVKKNVLGALTIYSTEPFAFGEEEVTSLEELANDLAFGIETLRTRIELNEREELFKSIINQSPNAIALIDPNTLRYVEANPAACSMLGYTHNEFINLRLVDIQGNMDEKALHALISKLLPSTGITFENKHITKSGILLDVEVNARMLELPGKHLLVCIWRDITDRKRAEEDLRITASVFDNTQEAIMITDANNNIIDVNTAFAHITGYSRKEVLGKNPKFLSLEQQRKDFYIKMWRAIQKTKAWRGEIWNRRKSGEIYAGMLSISAICNEKGDVQRYVSVFSDISHIKKHEAELKRIAHFDVLTGIPNRALLADLMKQAIAKSSSEKNMMAVCYLDLDGFKPINDTLGHDAGDQVLIEVAMRIENTIKTSDTVARLGGDEFVILLLGLERSEDCLLILERLLAAIAQPISVKNKFQPISASIGVSIYPLDNEDPDTLLRHADQAMYVAKQSGKNRFHIYDPALDMLARDHQDFLKTISFGLEQNQFELYYQPKVNLLTKELVGAEALIRWRHPERGLVSPGEFLGAIENTELDIELGNWVIANALAQINRWHQAGLDIEVSINISAYHLESLNFAKNLGQFLANYPDLPQGKLQIEVLETAALNDIGLVRKLIENCRMLGVGFALDDFGTGYSSLSYLSNLPIDVLKIDQSFVRDMLEDKGDMAIVQGIIALARTFNRQTVAEGIETDEHYQVLLDLGCELGQGYGIARPMPADKLIHWKFSSV